jgi:asparaginyl-tRNA synthetase
MNTNCVIRNVTSMWAKPLQSDAWINNKRSSGKIQFLQLRDGTGYIQGVVVKSEVSEEVWEQCQELDARKLFVRNGM